MVPRATKQLSNSLYAFAVANACSGVLLRSLAAPVLHLLHLTVLLACSYLTAQFSSQYSTVGTTHTSARCGICNPESLNGTGLQGAGCEVFACQYIMHGMMHCANSAGEVLGWPLMLTVWFHAEALVQLLRCSGQ